MKKIVVSLFLMVAMLSFSAKKNSAENEIRASFDRFMQDLKSEKAIDNTDKLTQSDIDEAINEMPKELRDFVKEMSPALLQLDQNNDLKNFYKKAYGKMSYNITKVTQKGNEGVVEVLMKMPDLNSYSGEIEKSFESKFGNLDKNTKLKDVFGNIVDMTVKEFSKILDKKDLKYTQENMKIYFEKVDGEWVPQMDFKKNKDLMKIMSFNLSNDLF